MPYFPIAERLKAGKDLRDRCPRAAHATWSPGAGRRDPLALLAASNAGRLSDLVPIRHGRMARSPFTFLRGAPAIMAADLAQTQSTGLSVQACGDCHLSNFGLFATPERNLVFDINDFDETLPAPWEWDVKRLAASFVVAGRVNGIAEGRCREAAVSCARSYREHLREFSEMSPLEVWYFSVTADDLIAAAEDEAARKLREKMAAKARNRVGETLFPKITVERNGQFHFVENPPLLTRLWDDERQHSVRQGIESYRKSLAEDRRFIFDRYYVADFALRVVGIGSVGTRCFVALFVCDDTTPLLLQIKEARRSVLEPFAAPSTFENQGQRVVAGQRLMQAASDIFLGWLRNDTGHDFYVRQLRDMKFSVPIEELTARTLEKYAEVCGWTLARAHAKSGDAAAITGYLGGSDKFDAAIGTFAAAYADQTEQDHATFVAAIRAGTIAVHSEDL